jgi:glyoxylase-like metal-dependent hydrolase (beta-lactamase superfamily II)
MRLHTLDLGFLGLDHSIAVFVLETPEGLALVEAGPASTLPRLDAGLHALGFRRGDFRHVFLSHIHFDHAGAAWAFAEAGATVYVHPKGAPHLAAPEKLYNSARMIYGEQMDSLWGEMRPIPEGQLRTPAHGETLEVVGLRCTAWHTPGHAVHHIAWEIAPVSGGAPLLFCGDVAGVRIEAGPVLPPCPPPDISVEDWQQSLQLLRELPVERLLLTHFGEIHDKAAHLDALERTLLEWSAWMQPHAAQGTPAEDVIPLFKAYVHDGLRRAGIGEDDLQRYEAANPAFMSVAGLLRYWKKKGL